MRRIAAHLALLPGEGLVPGVVVTLDDEGMIIGLARPRHLDGEAGVEFHSGILVPGFVNAHCHLELSHLRGVIPPGGGFTAFAQGMRSAQGAGAKLAAEVLSARIVDAARYWDARMWHEGVAAVGDVCNRSVTFGIKSSSPIRYHNFCELFGLGADPEKIFALHREAEAAGLHASVTPHSLYSLDSEAFGAVAGEVGATYPLSIHFMESPDEVELFEGRGAMWDWYAAQGFAVGSPDRPGLLDFLDYGSPAERLAAQVAPDRPVMLIHNCLVGQRDIDTVMAHFTAPVTWVLSPRSNRHISGLVPPIELLRANGLNIAVGTDSLASVDELSMVGELAAIEGAGLVEMLEWATIGGARALGLDDTLGTIAVGRTPGLAVIEGVDMRILRLTPNSRSRRII